MLTGNENTRKISEVSILRKKSHVSISDRRPGIVNRPRFTIEPVTTEALAYDLPPSDVATKSDEPPVKLDVVESHIESDEFPGKSNEATIKSNEFLAVTLRPEALSTEITSQSDVTNIKVWSKSAASKRSTAQLRSNVNSPASVRRFRHDSGYDASIYENNAISSLDSIPEGTSQNDYVVDFIKLKNVFETTETNAYLRFALLGKA